MYPTAFGKAIPTRERIQATQWFLITKSEEMYTHVLCAKAQAVFKKGGQSFKKNAVPS